MKEFPILGPDSVTASIISLASNMVNPDKYGDLHDRLMQHQGPYDEATLLAIAADAGYDPSKIQAAMTDKSLNSQIQNARAIAEALNIRGTPAFIIGDKIIPGAVPLQQLRSAIEEARANSAKKAKPTQSQVALARPIVTPPQINSTCPVTKLERSSIRNATPLAMSSGVPKRCTGIRFL